MPMCRIGREVRGLGLAVACWGLQEGDARGRRVLREGRPRGQEGGTGSRGFQPRMPLTPSPSPILGALPVPPAKRTTGP